MKRSKRATGTADVVFGGGVPGVGFGERAGGLAEGDPDGGVGEGDLSSTPKLGMRVALGSLPPRLSR